MSAEEALMRLARAYCPLAPKGEDAVHRRIVTVENGLERETCRYCGDVKEHAPLRFSDAYFEESAPPLPVVPDGYHLE